MSDNLAPESSIILYQTEDGRTRIECRFESDTIWLSQALIAELFQVAVPTVNEHLKGIFAEGEQAPDRTIRKFRVVRSEGSRKVARDIEHYSLPDAGTVSREQADAIAEHEYDQFAARRRAQLENEAEADGFKQLEDEVKKLPARKKPGRR